MHDPDRADGVRYLLGQLPEEEHARLERALLEHEESFQGMLALEDELFHEYAQGGLDAEERRRFEQRFLGSDAGRRRLAEARALLEGVRSGAARRALRLSWLLPVAAALALAAFGFWLASRRERGGEARVNPPSAAPAATRVALALAPGLTRDIASPGPRRVQLAPGDVLVLTLSLPATGAPPRVQARVLSAEGRQVWQASGLVTQNTPSGPVVVLEVPPGTLPEGDYQLLLAADTGARDEIADYTFTLLRR
jgi:hypothetical protein